MQDASNKYSASEKKYEDQKEWSKACSEFENFIYRNFVSDENHQWLKYHYDQRVAEIEKIKTETEKKTALTLVLEKLIDNKNCNINLTSA
jgi:hypothetical protein